MSSPNFIYLPPDGDQPGFWLNLALPTKISEIPSTGEMLIFYPSNPHGAIYLIKGQQAAVLRLHLMGRTLSHRPFPSGGLSDSEYFDRHTAPREPQLPDLPDPAIIPPAVRDFDEKISTRGAWA